MELPRGVSAIVFVIEQEAVLVADEEAGGDGVDADLGGIFLGHVHCQPLGEVAHACLGSRIGGDAGERAEGIHGGDVEDARRIFDPP